MMTSEKSISPLLAQECHEWMRPEVRSVGKTSAGKTEDIWNGGRPQQGVPRVASFWWVCYSAQCPEMSNFSFWNLMEFFPKYFRSTMVGSTDVKSMNNEGQLPRVCLLYIVHFLEGASFSQDFQSRRSASPLLLGDTWIPGSERISNNTN